MIVLALKLILLINITLKLIRVSFILQKVTDPDHKVKEFCIEFAIIF